MSKIGSESTQHAHRGFFGTIMHGLGLAHDHPAPPPPSRDTQELASQGRFERYAATPAPEQISPVAAAGPEAEAPAPADEGDPTKGSTVGPVPLEGYNYDKLNDPTHKSVKYQFGRVASHYPLDSVHDKASAEALLTKMLPDLKAAGLEVVGVKGDKIQVKTEIGYEWVDVVRGSGAPNPGWWWGSEGKGTPTPTAPGETAGPAADSAAPAAPPDPAAEAAAAAMPDVGSVGHPLEGLPSLPMLPWYFDAEIDTSSDDAAVKSAAEWVKKNHPELIPKGDDRATAKKLMSAVIGVLRAKGYDAHRCVNHPTLPADNPVRWGSDSLVLGGKIYDCFQGLGDPIASKPQAMRVGVYEPGRLRD